MKRTILAGLAGLLMCTIKDCSNDVEQERAS